MWESEQGPLRFVVEHRNPGPRGGPTLRVEERGSGRERLRFDCFLDGPHWHLDPGGSDAIRPIESRDDPIDWTLGELRRDLPGYLARAGLADAAPDAAALAPLLDSVEAALRNPPLDPDAVELASLRRRTGEKWRVYDEDVLAAWVADMDFPVAEPIRRVVQRALDDSDFGYPLHPLPTGLPEAFAERMASRFAWKLDPQRVELLTDVVQGIYVALQVYCEEGEGVVLQPPIYPPFYGAVRDTRRRLVENPLRESEGGFVVDLDGLDAAVDAGTRVLLLCNPHNPTGRVMTRRELEGIAEIALRRDLVVVADEISNDLVYSQHRHVPFASLSPEVEARTLTLTSATKAFNIAGLRCAVAHFGSAELRRRFHAVPRHTRGGLGSLGIAATLAAWRHAQPWQDQVLAYLEANRAFLGRALKEHLPGVRCHLPEATYLAWLDCRGLDLPGDPQKLLLERGRVALSPGPGFGTGGSGFVRLNFATSRRILDEILERMRGVLGAA